MARVSDPYDLFYDQNAVIRISFPPTTRRRQQPRNLKEIVAKVKKDADLNAGIEMLKPRAAELGDTLTAALVGIAMHGPARAYVNRQLDRIWKASPPKSAPEVIVGGGFHAAVYAAARVAMGHPKPVVLEKGKVGGTFAVSNGPSFYMNSRNRPGELGTPGRGEALNVLPGAPVQPAMLSGDEYQRNNDLAWAIRCTLALNARVFTDADVIDRNGGTLVMRNGDTLRAGRVIYATGLGKERRPESIKDEVQDRVLTFSEFMARMDEPFPLQGMGRVAVVGGGDGGKAAIEALTGQGPNTGMSVAGLDWPRRIDWYGVPAEQLTRDGWIGCVRSRYKSIGRVLPRNSVDESGRVTPLQETADQVGGGFKMVTVNGRRYDHVVWCTGYDQPEQTAPTKVINGREIARESEDGVEFVIGPSARLAMDFYEARAQPVSLPENEVALFRYAERTAALATALD